jgi:hypothetical protein
VTLVADAAPSGLQFDGRLGSEASVNCEILLVLASADTDSDGLDHVEAATTSV